MTTTAVTKQEPKTIIGMLQTDKMKSQMALALPKHCTIDRFMRMAITSVRRTPALANCTQESVFSCLMQCSQLGIEPDGRRAHLIPFKNECTLIIDYKGLVELALRSNMVATIHADVVCENDEFEFAYGSGGGLKHVPCLKGDRGKAYGAYSYAKMKDGSESYEWMSEEDIMKIKAMAPGARTSQSPWNNKEPIIQYEMWKKTVLRRHSKWLPLSSEFRDAADKDPDAVIDVDFVDHGSTAEGDAPPPKRTLPKLGQGTTATKPKDEPPLKPPTPEEPEEPEDTEEPEEDQEPQDTDEVDGTDSKPAVSGGITGATKPLGKKKRTLANPNG